MQMECRYQVRIPLNYPLEEPPGMIKLSRQQTSLRLEPKCLAPGLGVRVEERLLTERHHSVALALAGVITALGSAVLNNLVLNRQRHDLLGCSVEDGAAILLG